MKKDPLADLTWVLFFGSFDQYCKCSELTYSELTYSEIETNILLDRMGPDQNRDSTQEHVNIKNLYGRLSTGAYREVWGHWHICNKSDIIMRHLRQNWYYFDIILFFGLRKGIRLGHRSKIAIIGSFWGVSPICSSISEQTMHTFLSDINRTSQL